MYKLVALTLLAAGFTLCARAQQHVHFYTGLKGPVHTQLIIRHQLRPDPRPDPKKLTVFTCTPWLILDRQGNIIEESGNLDASGKPRDPNRYTVDEYGRRVIWTMSNGNGSDTVDRHEYHQMASR